MLCKLSDQTWVLAAGEDVEEFLQGQLSNDLAALDAAHSQLHGYCNPKGRLLCITRVVRHARGFLLQLPIALSDAIVTRLRRYVLRAKVALDTADGVVGIGIAGDAAVAALGEQLEALPDFDNGYLRRSELGIYGLPGPIPRYQIVGPVSQIQPLWESLSSTPLPQQPWTWPRLDILSGIPQIFPSTSEAFVPQMVNLDLIGGVSFQKGCYPGQEIVARMHYLGKLKQRMILARVKNSTAPEPGDKVYSRAFGEQSAGTIVDAQQAGADCFDVLAVVQLSAYQTGELNLNATDGPVLTPENLPYTVPTD